MLKVGLFCAAFLWHAFRCQDINASPGDIGENNLSHHNRGRKLYWF